MRLSSSDDGYRSRPVARLRNHHRPERAQKGLPAGASKPMAAKKGLPPAGLHPNAEALEGHVPCEVALRLCSQALDTPLVQVHRRRFGFHRPYCTQIKGWRGPTPGRFQEKLSCYDNRLRNHAKLQESPSDLILELPELRVTGSKPVGAASS